MRILRQMPNPRTNIGMMRSPPASPTMVKTEVTRRPISSRASSIIRHPSRNRSSRARVPSPAPGSPRPRLDTRSSLSNLLARESVQNLCGRLGCSKAFYHRGPSELSPWRGHHQVSLSTFLSPRSAHPPSSFGHRLRCPSEHSKSLGLDEMELARHD